MTSQKINVFCNPINVNYRYQFISYKGKKCINREAADPSMILFKGKYYIFASMTLNVLVSGDMVSWESRRLPDTLPLYDYAPDVRVIGDYVYFCASKRDGICDRYRTKDILSGPYETVPGTFPYWDPNLFIDDDGRVYFFWGCTNTDPIWGCELDPVIMNPKSERVPLLSSDITARGYERCGENSVNSVSAPYIEGAWLTKHGGRYYLQYACPGTEYNIYADGVFTADAPLGPYHLAENNPFSYKPGGFFPGAGHGSTMEDRNGNFWHTASMRISRNHNFERRLGLWPAGFDSDGELFCNQRYGDWPMRVPEGAFDPWQEPEWFPLHIGKKASASSFEPGNEPEKALEENVQTWWRAAAAAPGEWLTLDLGKVMDVRAVQINFADDRLDLPFPDSLTEAYSGNARFIDPETRPTRWTLEGSRDGESWFMIGDKSLANTDLPHDLIVSEAGLSVRFLKLTVRALPYGQKPAVSGLRVFGFGGGEKPAVPGFEVRRPTDLDMDVSVEDPGKETASRALGFNILFGRAPDKLYHSYMITEKNTQRVGALVKGTEYFVRVDAFNENGITEGTVQKVAGS